jgi:hypothetical protein
VNTDDSNDSMRVVKRGISKEKSKVQSPTSKVRYPSSLPGIVVVFEERRDEVFMIGRDFGLRTLDSGRA